MSNLSTKTWRFEVGLACWDFRMGVFLESHTLNHQDLIVNSLLNILQVLDPFAAVNIVSVTTKSGGEDAVQIEKDKLNQIREALSEHQDIEEIEVALDLMCTDLDGVETLVRESASLWLQLEPDVPDSPVRLLFSLDVDLYFPSTRGEISDNQPLAKLNYHKLNNFVDDLQGKASCKLVNVDAPHYKALIDSAGAILM